MSWIHQKDMVRLIVHAMFDPEWSSGVYNAVAPLPRRHLGKQGARVVLLDMAPDRLEAAAATLRTAGVAALPLLLLLLLPLPGCEAACALSGQVQGA
jgi:sirohydrochlorin ferrochelatase